MDKSEILRENQRPSRLDPLRILIVVNVRWDLRLGAVRVYADLAEQWRAAGHLVERFTLSEAFPDRRESRAGFAVRQVLFAYKAAAFVRKNRNRFDIIDALIGSLQGSRERLRFNGLLVARSVGLFQLYQEFERRAALRWSPPSRGTIFGRVLYTATRYWLNRVSRSAVHNADLINIPNETEAECLRQQLGRNRNIVVQPYGLTADRRKALQMSAAPPEVRLARRKVVFIGMWSARKGLHDWPRILQAIWRAMPEAHFCFLGTMVEPERILSDLGISRSDRMDFISQYDPEDLPALLADCAVGAFPSYVEGFGLAVLEQLAAGIPTVAFDVPGPGGILGPQLAELLVPAGNVDALSEKVCRILQLDPAAYERLSSRSLEVAASLDWSAIAKDTLEIYRSQLERRKNKILFIQPFSLGVGGGGGARILRALLDKAPVDWQSVCCSPRRPAPCPNEMHLPSRPSWGKIEMSRFATLPRMTMPLFAPRFRRRLKAFCQRMGARAIHAVPHSGLDFAYAQTVARDLSLPFFISLHDDLSYTASLPPAVREPAMRAAWLGANARFVISEALGQEYSRRYGAREYEVVTDGLNRIPAAPRPFDAGMLRVYFMGLFHLGYEANLRAFLQALVIYERQRRGQAVTMQCRCEHIRPHVWKDVKQIEVLPFADEAQIERDLQEADLLYMPMPFGAEHENFTRYSVSTKMVTYVGSGVPILYHGPAGSAAFEVLHRNNAAFFVTSLDPEEIAASLGGITDQDRTTVVANALALARREFMLAKQSEKFWGTMFRQLGCV